MSEKLDNAKQDKIPVSVLIQTKDEERSIRACIEGVKRFSEVIVVDSDSSDRTAEIALDSGAKVVNFSWDGKYPKKKQWQLDNVTTLENWILFLDADERPSPELLDELSSGKNQERWGNFDAFDVKIAYWFAGQRLKHGHTVSKRILVRKGRVRFLEIDDLDLSGMGELEGHYQPSAIGKTGTLRGLLEHDDRDDISTWFERHNKYSDWEAGLRKKRHVSKISVSRSRQGQIFQRVPAKAFVFFLYSYVLRFGFLDGRAGFDYAFALAAYYWQIDLKYRTLMKDVNIPTTSSSDCGR